MRGLLRGEICFRARAAWSSCGYRGLVASCVKVFPVAGAAGRRAAPRTRHGQRQPPRRPDRVSSPSAIPAPVAVPPFRRPRSGHPSILGGTDAPTRGGGGATPSRGVVWIVAGTSYERFEPTGHKHYRGCRGDRTDRLGNARSRRCSGCYDDGCLGRRRLDDRTRARTTSSAWSTPSKLASMTRGTRETRVTRSARAVRRGGAQEEVQGEPPCSRRRRPARRA